eukprot:81930_1
MASNQTTLPNVSENEETLLTGVNESGYEDQSIGAELTKKDINRVAWRSMLLQASFNFFGVLLGGLSVAYAIVHMLPTDLLLNMGSTHGLAMVFSMLLAAIIWNLGTWFFGLPASSSHTLIGAIIGIGLTNALLTGSSVMDALNLREVTKIF